MPFNYPEYTYELFNPLTERVDFWVDQFNSAQTQNLFAARSIHRYNTYAIIWRVEGDGTFQVDFQQETFADRSMVFLAPGQYFHLISGNVRLLRYRFLPSFLLEPENGQGQPYGMLFTHINGAGYIRLRKQAENQFRQLHLKIIESFTTLFEGDRTTLQQHLNQFLELGLYEWQNQQTSGKKMSREQAALTFRLKRLIDQHYMKNYTEDDFAEKLYVPSRQFRQFLKDSFSQSLPELVQQQRILEAKRQLVFTPTTFRTLAYSLGFNNEIQFLRTFKKETRLTAHNFRKEYGRYDEKNVSGQLLELISQYFRQELQTKFYADQLGMEEKALEQEIQRLLNRKVVDLIQQRMILEIQREIIFTNYSLAYIADRLNFLDIEQLNRFFRAATGISPNDFRSFWDRNPSISLAQRVHRFGTFQWYLRR